MIDFKMIRVMEHVLSNTRPIGIEQTEEGLWHVTLECDGAINYPHLVFKELPQSSNQGKNMSLKNINNIVESAPDFTLFKMLEMNTKLSDFERKYNLFLIQLKDELRCIRGSNQSMKEVRNA